MDAPRAVAAIDSFVVVWREKIGPSLLGGVSVDDRVVLAGTGDGKVVALSVATGQRHWSRRIGGSVAGGVAWRGGILFAGSEAKDGQVHRLRLTDGGRDWRTRVGSTSHAPVAEGGRVYVALDTGGVVALDAGTGERLWAQRLPGTPATAPVVADGEILVTTTADTLFWLDRRTGSVETRLSLSAGASAAPVERDGVLYLPLYSGDLVGIDLETRSVATSVPLGAPILAAPVVAEAGDLYVLTRSAEVWRIPRGSGEAERIAQLGGAARGSLALAGDRLLVGRLDGALFALELNGKVIWRVELEDAIVAPVAVAGNSIVAPLLRGTVVRLEPAR